MTNREEKIVVENVNVPGKTSRVNAAKYEAMKAAMLAVLPKGEPGESSSARPRSRYGGTRHR